MWVNVLGGTVLIRGCGQRAADHLKASLLDFDGTPRSSPDVIIDVDETFKLDRRFFRQPAGSEETLQVNVVDVLAGTIIRAVPPFPPMLADAYRDRFVRLHASTVYFPSSDRTVLITGRSGSGKTTLSERLVALGASLISDEDAFIYRRSAVVEPYRVRFPEAAGSAGGGVTLARVPRLITDLLFLHDQGEASPVVVSGKWSFSQLMQSQRLGGCGASEAIPTLLRVIRGASLRAVEGGSYAGLRQLAPTLSQLYSAPLVD